MYCFLRRGLTSPARRSSHLRRCNMDRVVHSEIPSYNKHRAMKFYADSFGWQLTDMPEMNYVIASTTEVDEKQMPKERGAINGGLMQRPKEAPHPTIYVGVTSVD